VVVNHHHCNPHSGEQESPVSIDRETKLLTIVKPLIKYPAFLEYVLKCYS